MTGEVHGQKFELRTKVSGKRLGRARVDPHLIGYNFAPWLGV